VVRAAEAGIEFGLLGRPQVGTHRVGPADFPNVEPGIGLHLCLDSPKGYAYQA
jgi:hypothetical protein